MKHAQPSQAKQILAALKAGQSLTVKEARSICGSERLSGRILELRRAGNIIITTMVKRGKKRFASYSLA